MNVIDDSVIIEGILTLKKLKESEIISTLFSKIRKLKDLITDGKKTLLITSCSKSKNKEDDVEACELYSGQFFKSVKEIAHVAGFDLAILSAKYGFLMKDDKISYYDTYIGDLKKKSNKNKYIKLKSKIHERMKKIIEKYDAFIVIMGNNYKELIEKFFNDKFIIFHDKRGIGGYKQVTKLILTAIR